MRITLTGGFSLPAPLGQVMALFTAEGERAWTPGWEPTYPDSAVHEVGQVWVTAGPPRTTWVTAQADADCVRYVRVADGDTAGIVTVAATADGEGARVTVSYDLTALSPAGEARLPQFGAAYDDMLEHWRHHTLAALHA